MPNLPKFTLDFNEKTDKWDLTKDATDRTVKSFSTKEQATERGALRKAIGEDGGSVKIQKTNGRFQEERTFPRSRDPTKSRG